MRLVALEKQSTRNRAKYSKYIFLEHRHARKLQFLDKFLAVKKPSKGPCGKSRLRKKHATAYSMHICICVCAWGRRMAHFQEAAHHSRSRPSQCSRSSASSSGPCNRCASVARTMFRTNPCYRLQQAILRISLNLLAACGRV